MQKISTRINLYVFAILSAIIVYGFALTNFSLTPDSELKIDSVYSLDLGRWGTNLVRYHLFNGLYPYFTLLVGLIFMAIASVEMTKLLKINGVFRYVFILMFLSFPQHAYQLVFTMQADAIGIGYFTSVIAVTLFTQLPDNINFKYIFKYLIVIILLLFSISIYQALILIPIILYVLYFFINLYKDDLNIKKTWLNVLSFIGVLALSSVLYLISVKLFCMVPKSGGYFHHYLSDSDNHIIPYFLGILKKNILGVFYYGENAYVIVLLGVLFSIYIFIKERKHLWIKVLIFIFLLIFPFAISIFTKEGANPPRIYLGSTVVFAFVITFLMQNINIKYLKQILFFTLIIFLWNSFYVTNLFYSSNKIFKHDVRIAENINNYIVNHFPNFNPDNDYVYFFGMPSQKQYEKISLPDSEIFSGSILRWQGGSNTRIINFFEINDIAYYRLIDNKEEFIQFKDSISRMPVFPTEGSIKKFNNTIVIKLGYTKGVFLPFEDQNELQPKFIIKESLKIDSLKIDIPKDESIIGGVDQFNQIKNEIFIKGWIAYDQIPSDETEISLLLLNNQNKFIVETNKELRIDVTEFFNDKTDYNSCGYFANFDVSNLPKGKYNVGLRLKHLTSLKDGFLPSDKVIEVK